MQIIRCGNLTRLLRVSSLYPAPNQQLYAPASEILDFNNPVVYYFPHSWNPDSYCPEIPFTAEGLKKRHSTSPTAEEKLTSSEGGWSADDVAALLSNDIILGVIIGVIIYVGALIVSIWGRPLISESGHVWLWNGDILGTENSQHILDWYTFIHILHGIILYALGHVVAGLFPRLDIGVRGFYIVALLLEALWESIENSPMSIKRYRETAVDGYYGDSLINSVSDMLAMSFGYWTAAVLPPLVVLSLAIADELFLLLLIRDNLTLKILQIIHPSEALSRWQADGVFVH